MKIKDFTIRPSVTNDMHALSCHLREDDTHELLLSNYGSPINGLTDSYNNSKICLSLISADGKVQAMAGVGWTANPRVGLAWLLSSDYIYSMPRTFLEFCRPGIRSFMQGHDVLYNNVHDANTKSMKWLKWLGFEETFKHPNFGKGAPFTEMSLFASEDVRRMYLEKTWPFRADVNQITGRDRKPDD